MGVWLKKAWGMANLDQRYRDSLASFESPNRASQLSQALASRQAVLVTALRRVVLLRGVAATVALTSSMCSACSRKPKSAANADPTASDQLPGTGSVSGGSGGGSEEAADAREGD